MYYKKVDDVVITDGQGGYSCSLIAEWLYHEKVEITINHKFISFFEMVILFISRLQIQMLDEKYYHK